jgi:hypothetical protein
MAPGLSKLSFKRAVEDCGEEGVDFGGGLGLQTLHGFQRLIFKMGPRRIA